MTRILDNNILLLAKNQEFKEVLINEMARALSVLRRSVKSRIVTAPPASPNHDDFYIVPTEATGAWSGKTNKIAYPVIDVNGAIVAGQWNFYEPVGTVFCLSDVAFLRWNGSAWQAVTGSGDMLKSTYDTDDDGVVDSAEKIEGIDSASDGSFYGKFTTVGFFNFASRLWQSLFNLSNLSTFVAGDLIYYDGSKFARLAKSGNPNQFLNGNLAWTTTGGNSNKLTADRTYYVSSNSGNDSNDGLSAGSAFLTIQKAIDVASSLDLGNFNITIQATGTFSESVQLKSFLGSGEIIILGDLATPSNCTISTGLGDCFKMVGQVVGTYRIEGIKMVNSNSSAYCLSQALGYGFMKFKNCDFGSAAGAHIVVGANGYILSTGNYTISGSAGNAHASAFDGGFIRLGETASYSISLQNFPNFSLAFAWASRGGRILAVNQSYSGSATGARYNVSKGSGIFTAGGAGSGSASYFPGSSAGSSSENGLYLGA